MKKEKYSLISVIGDAYAIMGYVAMCMRESGKTNCEIDTYMAEAKRGTYMNLINTSQRMINKLNKEMIK